MTFNVPMFYPGTPECCSLLMPHKFHKRTLHKEKGSNQFTGSFTLTLLALLTSTPKHHPSTKLITGTRQPLLTFQAQLSSFINISILNKS